METVISIFLVSMLMILLLNLYPGSVLAVRQAEQIQRADRLAQSLLADGLARPFGSLVVGTVEPMSAVVASGISFNRQLEVVAVDGDVNLIKGLRATVSWDDRGRQRRVVHEVWVPKIPR